MLSKMKNNKYSILFLVVGAVYFFLKYLVPLTAPFLVALLFVTIFGPLLQKMQGRWRIHRQIGAILLLVLACSVFGLLLWVLFSWIISSMPVWLEGLDTVEEKMVVVVHDVCGFLVRIPGVDTLYLEEMVFSNIEKGVDYFQQDFLTGVLSQSLTYLKILVSGGLFFLSFVIATILLAKDYDNFMNKMLDHEEYHVILEVICGIIRYLATYVKAQIVIMAAIGIFLAGVLSVARVHHGFLWGLLAGFLDALPFVGAGIVLIPLGVQLLFEKAYVQAAICLVSYIVCVIFRQGLEPKLIGKKVGVPPIMILLSLYAGIRLFNVWGILAGPLGYIIIQQTWASLYKKEEKKILEKDLTNRSI